MAKGEEFVLSYTHSANNRPVYDTIRVEGTSFLIVKSRFDSFGAGMPDASTERMKLQIGEDGWLEWIVNQPVPEISFFLGWVANHSLRVKGQEIPLVRLAEAGDLLSLRMDKVSLYDLWKGGCVR